jgi:hypothetical protein
VAQPDKDATAIAEMFKKAGFDWVPRTWMPWPA